jgi:hypothetical protein
MHSGITEGAFSYPITLLEHDENQSCNNRCKLLGS